MAIALNVLDGGSNAYNSPFDSASISPTADALVLLCINHDSDSDPTSVAGNGLTWVKVTHVTYAGHRSTIFRAMGSSPSSGVVSWNNPNSAAESYSIFEFTGVDTSGSNGSGAIVQIANSVGDGGGSPPYTYTVTLAAFGNVDNATLGVFGCRSNHSGAVGSGFTYIYDGSGDTRAVVTEYKLSNDTVVDYTNNDTAWLDHGFLALEIKAAAAAAASNLGTKINIEYNRRVTN